MNIRNTSPTRNINFTDEGGIVYTIEALKMLEVPDQVGIKIIRDWPEAQNVSNTAVEQKEVPWEHKAGPAWEEAKRAFGLTDGTEPTKPVTGPDTPPVEEQPEPSDAVDPETGAVNEKLTNVHLCTYCQKEYKRIGDLRNHMKNEHQV